MIAAFLFILHFFKSVPNIARHSQTDKLQENRCHLTSQALLHLLRSQDTSTLYIVERFSMVLLSLALRFHFQAQKYSLALITALTSSFSFHRVKLSHGWEELQRSVLQSVKGRNLAIISAFSISWYWVNSSLVSHHGLNRYGCLEGRAAHKMHRGSYLLKYRLQI